MTALDNILDEIALLEAERDFGNITEKQIELLTVLNFCYDLLSRTQLAKDEMIEQPEEMKEPGFEDDFVDKYGLTANYLADFTFALAVRKGEISVKKLVSYMLSVGKVENQITQQKIAEEIGIRQATISDFITDKKSMTAENIDKVINVIIK